MAGTNGRSTAQAERHARRAKEKADARREQATGAAGWVADRAGDWSLDAQDLGWMEVQKYLWNPLMDYWFRMEIEGFEKLPEPPALLIGIHSGAPVVFTSPPPDCAIAGAEITASASSTENDLTVLIV